MSALSKGGGKSSVELRYPLGSEVTRPQPIVRVVRKILKWFGRLPGRLYRDKPLGEYFDLLHPLDPWALVRLAGLFTGCPTTRVRYAPIL